MFRRTPVPSRKWKIRFRSKKFPRGLADAAGLAFPEREEQQFNNVQQDFPFEVAPDVRSARQMAPIPKCCRIAYFSKTGGKLQIDSTFQVCKFHMLSWSVCKISDSGSKARSGKPHARTIAHQRVALEPLESGLIFHGAGQVNRL